MFYVLISYAPFSSSLFLFGNRIVNVRQGWFLVEAQLFFGLCAVCSSMGAGRCAISWNLTLLCLWVITMDPSRRSWRITLPRMISSYLVLRTMSYGTVVPEGPLVLPAEIQTWGLLNESFAKNRGANMRGHALTYSKALSILFASFLSFLSLARLSVNLL